MSAGQADDKAVLRRRLLAARANVAHEAGSAAPERAAANFFRLPGSAERRTVSLYHAMRDELDAAPLLARLNEIGCTTALPVIGARDQALMFRRWSPGDVLAEASFGTFEPAASADIVVPETVVVPLAAFDGSGNRLGYGGGYYDRTLADLRKSGNVLAVGYAYAGQEVAALPADSFDQRLDWIVTEKGVRAFA